MKREPLETPAPLLLTVEQAAKQLGMGRTTLYSLIRSDKVESVRVGRHRRFRPEAVERYAASLLAKTEGRSDAT